MFEFRCARQVQITKLDIVPQHIFDPNRAPWRTWDRSTFPSLTWLNIWHRYLSCNPPSHDTHATWRLDRAHSSIKEAGSLRFIGVLLAPTADLKAMPIEDKQKRDLSHTPDRERSTRASPILTPRGGEWHPTSAVRLLEWLTPTCHVSSSTEQQRPAAFAGGRRLFLRSPVSLRSARESGGTWGLPP